MLPAIIAALGSGGAAAGAANAAGTAGGLAGMISKIPGGEKVGEVLSVGKDAGKMFTQYADTLGKTGTDEQETGGDSGSTGIMDNITDIVGKFGSGKGSGTGATGGQAPGSDMIPTISDENCKENITPSSYEDMRGLVSKMRGI